MLCIFIFVSQLFQFSMYRRLGRTLVLQQLYSAFISRKGAKKKYRRGNIPLTAFAKTQRLGVKS